MGNFKQNAYQALKSMRDAAELAAQEIRNKVMSDPTYAALNAECAKLGFEIARLGAYKQDLGNLSSTFEERKRLRDLRLKELGYTPADLEPHYNCPLCNDTGIVDGKECMCLKELVYAALRQGAAGVPTDIDAFNEELLVGLPEEARSNYGKIYSMLARYARDFPDNKAKIFGIYGPVGCGKSFAAGVLANAVMRKGYSVLFINAVQLDNLFLRYHTAKLADKEAIFEPLTDVDMLIIDDLGAETILNNVTVNYLYALLSARADRHVFITTNLSFEKLGERYGDRIASRLSDSAHSRFYFMNGKDLRLRAPR